MLSWTSISGDYYIPWNVEYSESRNNPVCIGVWFIVVSIIVVKYNMDVILQRRKRLYCDFSSYDIPGL